MPIFHIPSVRQVWSDLLLHLPLGSKALIIEDASPKRKKCFFLESKSRISHVVDVWSMQKLLQIFCNFETKYDINFRNQDVLTVRDLFTIQECCGMNCLELLSEESIFNLYDRNVPRTELDSSRSGFSSPR